MSLVKLIFSLLAIASIFALFTYLFVFDAEDSRSIAGEWTVTDETRELVDMTAIISSDSIEIHWIHESTSGLYWKGTAREKVKSGEIFVSEGDVEAMDASLLGSTHDSKTFLYDDNLLSFELSILGITRTISMERAS